MGIDCCPCTYTDTPYSDLYICHLVGPNCLAADSDSAVVYVMLQCLACAALQDYHGTSTCEKGEEAEEEIARDTCVIMCKYTMTWLHGASVFYHAMRDHSCAPRSNPRSTAGAGPFQHTTNGVWSDRCAQSTSTAQSR